MNTADELFNLPDINPHTIKGIESEIRKFYIVHEGYLSLRNTLSDEEKEKLKALFYQRKWILDRMLDPCPANLHRLRYICDHFYYSIHDLLRMNNFWTEIIFIEQSITNKGGYRFGSLNPEHSKKYRHLQQLHRNNLKD